LAQLRLKFKYKVPNSEFRNWRLAAVAILAANAAGYTRLVERDEAGTVNAWRALHSEFTDPGISEDEMLGAVPMRTFNFRTWTWVHNIMIRKFGGC
jgi:hypothetical protein|tara:strand:- start:573 stop:860 length:288 start_codon:yes stop_codon:yes gene_type:complete